MTRMSEMPLEGLVAGIPGMSCRTHGWISRRSPCLLCVEFLFQNEGLFCPLYVVVVVLKELFVFCM